MEGITLEPKRNNKRARRGAHGHPALHSEGGGAAKHQKYIAPYSSNRTKDHGVKDPID